MSAEVTTELTFDREVTSVEAVQKAAYRAINLLHADISTSADKIYCSLSANADVEKADFEHALEEFRKDVLDYQLRIQVRKETEDVRNLILGLAFSRTGLQASE